MRRTAIALLFLGVFAASALTAQSRPYVQLEVIPNTLGTAGVNVSGGWTWGWLSVGVEGTTDTILQQDTAFKRFALDMEGDILKTTRSGDAMVRVDLNPLDVLAVSLNGGFNYRDVDTKTRAAVVDDAFPNRIKSFAEIRATETALGPWAGVGATLRLNRLDARAGARYYPILGVTFDSTHLDTAPVWLGTPVPDFGLAPEHVWLDNRYEIETSGSRLGVDASAGFDAFPGLLKITATGAYEMFRYEGSSTQSSQTIRCIKEDSADETVETIPGNFERSSAPGAYSIEEHQLRAGLTFALSFIRRLAGDIQNVPSLGIAYAKYYRVTRFTPENVELYTPSIYTENVGYVEFSIGWGL